MKDKLGKDSSMEKMKFTNEDRKKVIDAIHNLEQECKDHEPKSRYIKRLVPFLATFLLIPIILILFPSLPSGIINNTSTQGDKVTSFLFMSKNASQRTENHWVMAYNKETKKVKAVVIPRDTYIPIVDSNGESLKQDKLAHAYAYGLGITSVKKTVENFLKVPIDYSLAIDEEQFMEMIDRWGGIDVESSEDETIHMPNGEQIKLRKGKTQLYGRGTALLLSFTEEDVWDEADQLSLIKQIYEEVKEHYTEDSIPDRIETNITLKQLNNLDIHSMDILDIEIGSEIGRKQNGSYMLKLDKKQIEKVSKELME